MKDVEARVDVVKVQWVWAMGTAGTNAIVGKYCVGCSDIVRDGDG